VKQSRRAGCLW